MKLFHRTFLLGVLLATNVMASETVSFTCGGAAAGAYLKECMPFGLGNTFVEQGAVDTASKDHLKIGDTVIEDFIIDNGACTYKFLEFSVVKSPVTSLADLKFEARGENCM